MFMSDLRKIIINPKKVLIIALSDFFTLNILCHAFSSIFNPLPFFLSIAFLKYSFCLPSSYTTKGILILSNHMENSIKQATYFKTGYVSLTTVKC